MMNTCTECGSRYDDARATTICPHEPFLSEEMARQKDLALSLLGKTVCFAHLRDELGYRVCSVNFEGMVCLDGMAGEFAPHIFVVKDA